MAKRVFFPTRWAGLSAGLLVAGLMLTGVVAGAQATPAQATPAQATQQAPAQVPDPQLTTPDAAVLATPENNTKRAKKEKVVQTKDTRRANKKEKKVDPLAGADAKLPDKQLYDKALIAVKRGRFDVARLDLQTLLNTYPDSQYMMRAKLAIADSWYREGGTAALTQAEQEYKDFITFFPNAPEAAEAQMRVGDIYFRQMDKPDRDYAKAVHAEEEYRLMLQQFPDSPLVKPAKQRLREVQEVLATREASIAGFYSTRDNWPATIARYQTVADTYPQFSHTDDVLIGMGDAYEAEARYVRLLKNLPEAGRAQLERTYDERAADAYRKVVLEHAASPHVEDAKDRLAAMNVPIPTPTADQLAASVALENSRGQYTLAGRARLLVLHTPDVVATATAGEPLLVDPKPTLAPDVRKQIIGDFDRALNPNAKPATAPAAVAAASAGETPATAPVAAAPLSLNDVPAPDSGGANASPGAVMTAQPAVGAGLSAPGASVGAEIVTHSAGDAPLGSPADVPRSSAGAPAGGSPTGNSLTGGLPIAGPANTTALPPIEKAGAAPDAVNDIKPGQAPPAQTPAANGKNKKPEFDKSEESSSKHKKKKGLKKLNPL